MADPARIPDQSLPPEIAEKMTAAGFSPQVATLVEIIENSRGVRLKLAQRPSASPSWNEQPKKCGP
jgi:hypothetical protein